MDLLNITNWTKIHDFFIFQTTVLKFGDLLGGGGGLKVGNKCKILAKYLNTTIVTMKFKGKAKLITVILHFYLLWLIFQLQITCYETVSFCLTFA